MTCCPNEDSQFLVSRYSPPLSERAGIKHFLIRNISARRGIDGPQIILKWNEPEDSDSITLLRIQRKLYEFPLNESDGITVYEGPSSVTTFADCEDVPAGKCLYYTIFTYNQTRDKWFGGVSTRVNILSLKTGDDHWRRFFTYMGENIIVADKDKPRTEYSKIALQKITADDGECFNIHEVGERKGQLARFYKVLGALYDEAKELITHMTSLRDVNETCYQYLPGIAALLGLDLNRELSIKRQRLEIKNRVAILKIKGTLDSIRAVVRSVTGYDADVREWSQNIFISNQSTTPTADASGWSELGGSDDNNYYLIDGPNGERSCNSISINIDVESSKICLSPATISKLTRALKEVLPICAYANICWINELQEEDYDTSEESDFYIEGEVRNNEENVWENCWFTANHEERGIVNSRFITPIPGGTCGEEWWYEEERKLLVSRYAEPIITP